MLSQLTRRSLLRLPRLTRHVSSNAPVFLESDQVWLRHVQLPDKTMLVGPLKPGKTVNGFHGIISHDDIIGRSPREVIASRKGTEFRITWPTLEEYVTSVKRLVTPVYPLDAATIVNLLDIHVDAGATPPLEIFEAGTGHGSLTLALARAIHAGNSHIDVPNIRGKKVTTEAAQSTETAETPTATETVDAVAETNTSTEAEKPINYDWKSQRGAVIHTLDISATHSEHARKVVGGFRRGMYKRDVEFYVGDPSVWMQEQLVSRGLKTAGTEAVEAPEAAVEPKTKENAEEQAKDETPGFLYAVILDLPGPENHLSTASEALLNDGIVGVFCPSITQVGACVRAVKDLKLPLVLDKVVEFPGGSGVGAGLRSWDVRYARVRSRAGKKISLAEAENRDNTLEGRERRKAEKETEDSEYEMVCRPTSFERIVGGGFFGLFRRRARGGEGVGCARNIKKDKPEEVLAEAEGAEAEGAKEEKANEGQAVEELQSEENKSATL
ncbi:adenine-N(1)--methyltransferase [Pyronema omphalodes]|nr:adenine-N(1)--methyltransferase [Pyronema omphalodes]